MKHKILSLMISLTCLVWHIPSAADTVEERLRQLEQQLRSLEAQIAEQGGIIREKNRRIAELERHSTADAPSKTQQQRGLDRLEFNGLLELEAAYQHGNAESSSDFSVATMELGIAAQVNDWIRAETVLLWEEDGGDFNVDQAIVTFANPERTGFSFTAGLATLAFGEFTSHMVSDPLTLELGETRKTQGSLTYTSDGWFASAYLFHGEQENQGNHLSDYGAYAGYTDTGHNSEWMVGAGYLTNLAESELLHELSAGQADNRAAAYAVNAHWHRAAFTLIGEYLSAAEALRFDNIEAQPSAWNLEAGYQFELGGKSMTLALGYQQTKESEALGLPERRLSAMLGLDVLHNTTLKLEFAADRLYANTSDKLLTAQLAFAF